MICYRQATLEDLERIWDYNMAMDPEEPRMTRWRESYITRNKEGRAATFVAVIEGEPVGEVTLDFHAEAYGNADTRKILADGCQRAYVTALRIRREFEGLGYVSGLMRFMENEARNLGYTSLSIGVGAEEARNLAIYLHWGYNQFITGEFDGGELVLFYAKAL